MGIGGRDLANGVLRAFGYALGAFGGMCLVGAAGAVGFQRHIIYPLAYGRSVEESPPKGWRRVDVPSSEGGSFAWVSWESEKAPTVLVFHGNAASLWSMAWAAKPWQDAGWNVVLAEFPGYGGAPGEPSIDTMDRSALDSWRWIADQGITPIRLVVVGNSIGAGPASSLAAAVHPSGLILVSGVARMADVVDSVVGAPVGGLLFDPWDNVASVREAGVRTAVWHGLQDRLVPRTQAPLLASAGHAKVRYLPGGHDLYWSIPLQRSMVEEASSMVGASDGPGSPD